METLSIGKAISFGWKTFWSRPWIFVNAGILMCLVLLVVSLPQIILAQGSEVTSGALSIELFILALVFAGIKNAVTLIFEVGGTHFMLKAHEDHATLRLRDLLHIKPFWSYVGASILLTLAVLLGLILLIVPGIILSVAFSFVLLIVVDTGADPIKAMKESWRITKGHWWKLFLFMLVLIGINILGACALLAGLLVTIPVSMLASIHMYRFLEKNTPIVSTSSEVVS